MTQPKKIQLFIDHDKYEWDKGTITGAELRTLAAIPESVQIFQHVSGKPDIEIKDDTIVDLENHHGPAKFSTQSPGSQAG